MRHPGERRRRVQNGSKDHGGWLPRTHEKFFNIRKENMSNPSEKGPFSSGAFTSFQSQRWRLSRMPGGYSGDSVRPDAWIRNPRLRDPRPRAFQVG